MAIATTTNVRVGIILDNGTSKVDFYTTEAIKTSEIYEHNSLGSCGFEGIKFYLIEKVLRQRGYIKFTMCVPQKLN